MYIRFTLLIAAVLIFATPAQAKETKYNHNSITLEELRDSVDFKVFAPQKVPDQWSLEIKTYPANREVHFSHFRIHYMDSIDSDLLLAITQKDAAAAKDEIRSPKAQKVIINGHKAYFEKWGNTGKLGKKGQMITGGLLSWTQDGTYIQLHSPRISKKMMLDLARSMKEIN